MKFTIFFFFTLCFQAALGQELIQDLIDPQYQNSALLKLGGKEVKAPYWLEEFEAGFITLKSGKVINNMKLNIDMNSGNLIASKDNDEVIINSKIVDRVQFYNLKRSDTLTFKQITIPGNGQHFCEVIYDGNKIRLYRQLKATLKPNTQDANTGYHTDKPKDTFVKKTFYFLEENGVVKETKLNKKTLLKNFETITGLDEIIKENKLDLNDVVDVKLFLKEIEKK